MMMKKLFSFTFVFSNLLFIFLQG